jgi:serine/threonine-protein kinase
VNARALPKRAFPYLIVAVTGFLLAYLGLFLFAFPADVLPDDGRIPRVVGMSYDNASAALEKAGFHALKGDSRFHKTTPEGIVLEQDPPAGSVQKRGAEVTLAVSSGQANATVPDVSGTTQQQAQIAIENAGFTFGSVSQQTSDQPRGAVIGTNPPAGTTLDLPATVSIMLSQGPSTIQLPDLTGRTLADARSALEQLGLHLGGTTRDTSSFMPENTVLGQTPGPGLTVSAGASVSLRVSRFPPPPRVVPSDTSTRIDSLSFNR